MSAFHPWHHAPPHILIERGVYFVTTGTMGKKRVLHSPARLKLVHDRLHECSVEYGWKLHAWAVLANHYHFIAESPEDPKTLSRMLNKLHTTTAIELNRQDNLAGRKVWCGFWDARLTFERSYLARLHYVNENPVRHGVVPVAVQYPWCSAARFAAEAEPSFRRTVNAMPIDRLEMEDDF